MLASRERRQVAARIGLVVRWHGPDAPELPALRARLNELRIAEVAAWLEQAEARQPGISEVEAATRDARLACGGDGP
jgi:hypothetical protein